MSRNDLSFFVEQLRKSGVLAKPEKQKKRETRDKNTSLEDSYRADQEHPPTGYPCRICGKVVNIYHKGVQESEL